MTNILRFFILLSFLILGMPFSNILIHAQSNPVEEKAEELLDEIHSLYLSNNLDSLYLESHRLIKFSMLESLPYYEAKSKYYLGRYFLATGDLDSSFYFMNSAENLFYQLQDTLEQGKLVFMLGAIKKTMGDQEEALVFYTKAAELLELAGDTLWFGIANDHMAFIFFKQANYIMALKHFQSALEALELLNDVTRIGGINNTMGLVYRKTGDREKEELAYLNAIENLSQKEPSLHLGMAYSNLSEVYLDKGEVEKAFETLEKAKEIYETIDYPLGLCSYYAVLSYYHTRTDPPDYLKVIEYSKKSVAIAEEYEDYRQYADATSFLGKAYIETNQFNKAKEILLKGLAAAEEHNYRDEIMKVNEVLSEAYDRTGQPGKALYYLKQYIQFRDSISSEEKVKEFTRLDLNFKFRQQQLSDSLTNVQHRKEMQIQYENEIQTQRYLNYFFIVISILVITFAIFMIFARRRLKKVNLLLAEKNDQIIAQKNEIEAYAENINRAYSKLQELDEYKQAMINMIVHDLKNPLHALENIEVFEDENTRRRIIKHSSKKMLNLVMNMLDVNQAENNNIKLEKTELFFNDIAASSIQEVDLFCFQKNIKIQNVTSHNYKFSADSYLIGRVFVNLFSNAIKFSPKNGTIILDAGISGDDLLTVSIRDEGPGIDQEYHQVIFEKFKQIKKVKTGNIGSTGLGLAFCKMAVEMHGWTIGVDSQPGKGAEFWIKINEFQQ